MNKEQKIFLGKKRNKELSDEINSSNNNNINHKSGNINKDKYKEIKTLNFHSHWINKILILKNQLNHNLISSSADGLIILYDVYPKYNPLLKMKLFGDSGVINLTELKNGLIIACSFAEIKQISIFYDENKKVYNYEIINNYIICSTYVIKCLELFNENLLCITQQNCIIILKKNNENEKISKKNNNYKNREIFELLQNELCVNILQLTNNLFISCNINNSKYDLSTNSDQKNNINCIKFYDKDFNFIRRISKFYPTKSQSSMLKINDKLVLVGVEASSNEINWNNRKGVILINYKYLELLSFYETDNQISSMILYQDMLFFGDDKGYIIKYKLEGQEIIKQNIKKIHQYNIITMEVDYIYNKDINQNIFILLTGSHDQKIKILSD